MPAIQDADVAEMAKAAHGIDHNWVERDRARFGADCAMLI